MTPSLRLAWRGSVPATLLVLALSGCRTACPPTSRCGQDLAISAATFLLSLPEQAGGGHLVVENVAEEAAVWYHMEGACFTRLALPPVALLMVDSLAVSPDGRYIAVISVGEGHPVLDVLDLARALGSSHGDRALATINPYPGWIAVDAWRDGALLVSSDRPLPECCDLSGAFSGEEMLDPPQSFLLDPSTSAWVSPPSPMRHR